MLIDFYVRSSSRQSLADDNVAITFVNLQSIVSYILAHRIKFLRLPHTHTRRIESDFTLEHATHVQWMRCDGVAIGVCLNKLLNIYKEMSLLTICYHLYELTRGFRVWKIKLAQYTCVHVCGGVRFAAAHRPQCDLHWRILRWLMLTIPGTMVWPAFNGINLHGEKSMGHWCFGCACTTLD